MNFYEELQKYKKTLPELYEIITKHLINAKGRIEGQRITEKFFNKNNLDFNILEKYKIKNSQNLYDLITKETSKCSFNDCNNERRWIGMRDGYKLYCEKCSRTKNNWLTNVKESNKIDLELNEIYDFVKDKNGNYNTSKLLQISDKTLNALKEETKFIQWDASVAERLYCYENSITKIKDLPKCQICSEYVTEFYASSKGYRTIHKGVCSKKNRNKILEFKGIIKNENLEYFTEDKLESLLKELYPSHVFIRDKVVPNSGINARPDFRCDELKLIVEYDGERHFRLVKAQMLDELKDKVYKEMGYKIIRIPYFIQPSKPFLKYFFGIDKNLEQTYPHGFINTLAALPSDFNSLGAEIYKNIMREIPKEIRAEIEKSLERKTKEISKKLNITINAAKKYVYF